MLLHACQCGRRCVTKLPVDGVSAIHLMRPDLASLATLTSQHEGYTALDSVPLFRRLIALHPKVYVSPVHTPILNN
jgi:hypothetical protein